MQTDLSFRVGGKIIQRMVDVGDRVTARQVLAKLDPKDLQTNVDSAQAQVVAEQARVKQTAAAFVRQEKLLPKGYTSRSEYDSAQAALRSSQSALAAAQAQLANAREQLGYTALIAEAPGVITARQAEVGQVVQATVPIFSLASDGERDAVFNVYESLLVEPPPDAPITVSLLDNPSIKAQGKVREVTPAVAANTGTVQVKIALQSSAQRHAAGFGGQRHRQWPGQAERRAAVVGTDQRPQRARRVAGRWRRQGATAQGHGGALPHRQGHHRRRP